ncbi:MAG TPA: molybdopterin cofactor-binding domain-containing protein [Pseudonocardiaceae bacterium]|nr:molybdopterin cofactor-binding domain-containing protein [Pseudonocardiaceae bacterium]
MARHTNPTEGKGALGRRRFLTYLVAAPTLTIAARWGADELSPAQANALPQLPSPTVPDFYDLGDALKAAADPTSDLLRLEVTGNGRIVLELPRAEIGQGITTTMAMLVAEEMGAELSDVDVVISDARPELLFNQLTGASVSTRALFGPVRLAASAARLRLLRAYAEEFGYRVDKLKVRDSTVVAPDGQSASFGSLTAAAAKLAEPVLGPSPKPFTEYTLVGKPTTRIDQRNHVTGKTTFAWDLDIPGAKPAIVARAPQVRGTVEDFDSDALRTMSGVIDVARIPTGIAIVAETFGQALAAQKAIKAKYGEGRVAGLSDSDLRTKLRAAAPPLTAPTRGPGSGQGHPQLGAKFVGAEFDWAFVNHAPLEPNSAVADVREDSAEIWSELKSPVYAQNEIAKAVGLPADKVTVHVVRGGGSFGRRLFPDAAVEAAQVSQAVGRPVKLMWSRADDMQHGRMRPRAYTQHRFTYGDGQILSYEERVCSVETDYRHGIGEALTAAGAHLPGGDFTVAQAAFNLMVTMPYDFGRTTQVLNEIPLEMNTGSWRAVYAGYTHVCREILIDEMAAELGEDPVEFRRTRLKNDRVRAVLDKVVEAGAWGRTMRSGHAQGFAINEEHRSAVAVLVEIDATDRRNPRVYKAVMAFDAGLPINPRGLEAQMLSGLNDGISTVLYAGNHLDDGAFRETSYTDFGYAKQRHYPINVEMYVMPKTTDDPGGAGETTVAAAGGAVANAYARATGTKPRSFPIDF